MNGRRRALLGLLSGAFGFRRAVSAETSPAPVVRRLLIRFAAGTPGRVDLRALLRQPGGERPELRLRADLPALGQAAGPYIAATSQYPEYEFDGTVLRFDGGGAAARQPGPSAVRLQLDATERGLLRDGPTTSTSLTIVVEAPPARLRHGLDSWDSFDALARAVQGDAPQGSAPRGRTDLIGQTFEITPGMLSEPLPAADDAAPRPAPVAAIQFPCTVTALDPRRRPVLRSVSGERDIVQIQAQRLPPIDGEVVLRDLVIRDNRAWYNTGEAGVRLKDKFPGRSVRIERCEFVRCQNAVAGGSLGQTLRVIDCRIVDCGFGDQAHALYVSPEWLEFHGNLVVQSTGNRLARAHLLKSRALNARIVGNRFALNDCPGSYLIDLSNGGVCEVGGNEFQFGPASDNSSATLIAYAAEGAASDFGGGMFAPRRRFALSARNNTMVSAFPGRTVFFVVDRRSGPRSDGGMQAETDPDPLLIADNVCRSSGPAALLLRRDRRAGYPSADVDATSGDRANSLSADLGRDADGRPPGRPIANAAGPYEARRFVGTNDLGTGSEPYTFTARGAGA